MHRNQVVVVEDASMTLRAHRHGYYGVCVWQPTGEWVPGSLEDLEAMWARWAYGTCQVLVKYWYLIFGFARDRLTLMERVDVLQHTMGYVALGLTPLWIVLPFVVPGSLYGTFMSLLVLAPFITHCGAFVANRNFRGQYGPNGRLREFLIAMFLIESFLTWVKCKAIWRYAFHASQGWKPTGKGAREPNTWPAVLRRWWDVVAFSSAILAWFVAGVFGGIDLRELLMRVPAAVIAGGMLATIVVYGRTALQESRATSELSMGELTSLQPDLPIYSTQSVSGPSAQAAQQPA
jgi:hypothetical protein